MYRRRLAWFLAILTALAVVIALRLGELQVVRAAEFDALAARILTQKPTDLPAPRGGIYDRRGRPLLTDEPAFDISVRYEVLTFTNRESYLRRVARGLRERGDYPTSMKTDDIVAKLQRDISAMWQEIEALTGLPAGEVVERAEALRRRVELIRRNVEAHAGRRQRILEETWFHPVLTGIDEETVLAARLELDHYPWLAIVPSSRRLSHDADAFCHILGRTGQASAEMIANDSLRDDELRALRPGQSCGVSGVERLAETELRGTRGRIEVDYAGGELGRIEPVRGTDVYLTIDGETQAQVTELLRAAVEDSDLPAKAGASAVVIDVATREVLALASYPGYHYDTFREEYTRLRQDTRRLPTLFRAVQKAYPPGSTCKAITLVGGLSDHKIAPTETINCTGFLLPARPDRFRCWYYKQYRRMHGPQDAETAIRNSCNIYFFKVGGRLGADRLCHWFSQFGFGRTAGTGLIEETAGVCPDAEWLARHRPSAPEAQPADPWNWAIGQGEVNATPLQVANVAASIASGRWEPVRLVYDAEGNWINPVDAAPIQFDESAVRVLRRGMWRVVNDSGTAKFAKIDDPQYELCGKTGSAQTPPLIISRKFTVQWPDGRREEVIAPTKPDALAQFDEPKPEVVGWRAYERFPDVLPGELATHAWFMGFTQPKATPRGERPTGRSYAISVVIELGGSGGRVASPVGKQIAEWILENQQEP